jgi:MYXO-CTERM domain-containing protein
LQAALIAIYETCNSGEGAADRRPLLLLLLLLLLLIIAIFTVVAFEAGTSGESSESAAVISASIRSKSSSFPLFEVAALDFWCLLIFLFFDIPVSDPHAARHAIV